MICLDNLITGIQANIEHLTENENFRFINADVNRHFQLEEKVDYIFHLASPASPVDYQDFPEETLITNSIGTLRMLKLAEREKAVVLIASTSEVYGDPKEHPQKETYLGNVNTFGPRACYDESKRFGETAAYVFINKYKVDARIVRIFNTYGPRMQKDDGRVVSNFINQALKDDPLKIDGDGSQTRSFCYVSDMVDGIFKAMFTPKASGEIINLGNPDEFTIKDLAQKVIGITKSGSAVEYSKSFRQDDPMKRKPDISKAKRILDWGPKVNLEEGLQKTIEYYRKLVTSD